MIACVLLLTHSSPVLWVTLAVAGATGLIFGSLTVEVDHERLTFWFGPGVFRRSYALSDVQSCKTVANPWWYGWGIHLTPAGWLYNVSGRQAVEVALRSARTFRLGTDEPEQLCGMIQRMKGAA